MAMAAGGMRGELADSVVAGFGLAFKADVLWVGTGIKGVDGPEGRLAAAAAAVTRYWTGLEASRGYSFERGLAAFSGRGRRNQPNILDRQGRACPAESRLSGPPERPRWGPPKSHCVNGFAGGRTVAGCSGSVLIVTGATNTAGTGASRPRARTRHRRRPHPSSASDSTNRTSSTCREMECFW